MLSQSRLLLLLLSSFVIRLEAAAAAHFILDALYAAAAAVSRQERQWLSSSYVLANSADFNHPDCGCASMLVSVQVIFRLKLK